MPVLPSRYIAFIACSALLWLAVALPLQAAAGSTAGIAWRVQGRWHIVGNELPIRNGDAISPASLLMPGNEAGNHSITVLLPDGQRVLYECFSASDCARGFRVPALTAQPSAFVRQMIARIRESLIAKRDQPLDKALADRALQASHDEAVVAINRSNRVHLAGLVTDLSPGRYTYDLRPLDSADPPQHHQPLEKGPGGIDLPVPAPGLYILTIADALKAPRVNFLFAAVEPSQSAHFASFDHAREIIEDWNGDYGGWPVDDFLRAYLESLSQKTSLKLHPAR